MNSGYWYYSIKNGPLIGHFSLYVYSIIPSKTKKMNYSLLNH